jgi:putative nucleotidyltransferase with HDIG domain
MTKKMGLKLNFLSNTYSSTAKSKKKTSIFKLFIGLLIVTIIAYLIYIPQQKAIIDYQPTNIGDIVKEDIIINKDITIEDKESTEENRKQAKAKIIPVYEYYGDIQTKARDAISQWFDLIRNSKTAYNKNKNELANIRDNILKESGLEFSDNELISILRSPFFSKVDLNQLLNFIISIYDKKILNSLTGMRKSPENKIRLVSRNSDPIELQVEQLYDLKKVKTALADFIRDQNIVKNRGSIDFISSILMEFINVNIAYSKNLTLQEELNAAAEVNPVLIKLKADKVILRKGDEVKEADLKILRLIATKEKIMEQKLSNFFLILLILVLLSIFGNKFFKLWKSVGVNMEKIFIVLAATLTVSAIVYRVCIFLFPLILKNISLNFNYDIHSIFYAIPFGFGILVIAFIFNLQSAVIFSFINSIIGGIICNWDFKIVVFILLGNLAASFGIEFYQRLKRVPIIKASILWMLPINIITIVIFNLTQSSVTLQYILVNIFMAIFASIFAPVLANFIIPLWESLFKLVTELKLIELTNLNLPLFREMLEKAPGTYHHSQMVASLSETAALDLGLSPLLQTAMALYHDIGKIENPHFFTENHSVYKDPHEQLSPRESAKNIIAHIQVGLERAEKIDLPAIIRSSIIQHHGTKLVSFFYNKAREMSSVDSNGFEDKDFRYQGEKPKNIENAIIMLADQVEAASKSLASPSDKEIKNVIRQIIDANIDENQFDQCEGLTFKALNTIANSFFKKLSSIYQLRIAYPTFDFKEKDKEAE